jgi:hypothetical protein
VANTSYLRSEVEGYVRDRLAEEFRQPFASEIFTLRPGGRHEFDAVGIGPQRRPHVKSASGMTSGVQLAVAIDRSGGEPGYIGSLLSITNGS